MVIPQDNIAMTCGLLKFVYTCFDGTYSKSAQQCISQDIAQLSDV